MPLWVPDHATTTGFTGRENWLAGEDSDWQITLLPAQHAQPGNCWKVTARCWEISSVCLLLRWTNFNSVLCSFLLVPHFYVLLISSYNPSILILWQKRSCGFAHDCFLNFMMGAATKSMTTNQDKKCSFYCFQSVTARDIADRHNDVHPSKISSSALLHNTQDRTLDWFGRVCLQWRDGRGPTCSNQPQHCKQRCTSEFPLWNPQ